MKGILDINTTVRCKDQENDIYTDIGQSGIKISIDVIDGDGSSENPYYHMVKIENISEREWEGIVHFEISTEASNARFFLPAFIYGRNRGEQERIPNSKLNPRIREGEVCIPYSPFWMTRSDRLSHPVAMLYTDERIIGISSSPYRVKQEDKESMWSPGQAGIFSGFNGFSCSLGKKSSVGFTVGYEDAPYKYINADGIQERKVTDAHCIKIGAGENVEIPLYVYDIKTQNESGIIDIIENVYWRYHEQPREGAGFEEGIEDISGAICEDTYMDDVKSYATMLTYESNTVNRLKHTSISWTGGVEIGTPMLMAALRKNNQEMREQALECIQNIVDYSLNEKSGLPYESFVDGEWSVDGWWQFLLHQRGHSSYVVGQALYYILKAYDYEKRFLGILHNDWIDFVEQVLQRIETTKNQEGEFPYIWSEEDGTGIEYDSFAGCWCLTSMVYLAVLKNDIDRLKACFDIEKHYYEKFVLHMECYGTPIDTYKAVDSEGILAYIRAVKMIHEQTKEDRYLEHLKHALEYEFSFKFCYNVPIQAPPLSRLQWSCSGGSVTSTANHHIHPMSNGVTDEILYYINCTGDVYYIERLKDTIGWGLQTYNRFDGEYDHGKKGWMSERFCYSEGILDEKYEDGSLSSTWFYFFPWGAANILEGMCGDIYEVYKEYGEAR